MQGQLLTTNMRTKQPAHSNMQWAGTTCSSSPSKRNQQKVWLCTLFSTPLSLKILQWWQAPKLLLFNVSPWKWEASQQLNVPVATLLIPHQGIPVTSKGRYSTYYHGAYVRPAQNRVGYRYLWWAVQAVLWGSRVFKTWYISFSTLTNTKGQELI